jgi:deoxyribodipyrimidine photo-lyase
MKPVIWWLRRDLRLADNQALTTALQNAERVLPVFILDPHLVASPWVGEKRLGFLFASLRALNADLRSRGSRLTVHRGDPVQMLKQLVRETGAGMVYAEADYSPYARKRDRLVAQSVPMTLTRGVVVLPPESILKSDGTPYTIFTPYSRAWKALYEPVEPLPAPDHIQPVEGVFSEVIPSLPDHQLIDLFPAGEAEAQKRLEKFAQASIDEYHEKRDRMDLEGTSSLSPYLRFGMVSARQTVWAAHQARARAAGSGSENGSETWLNELIWREFYVSILYHFPHVRHESFRPQLRTIPWRNGRDEFRAWAEGRTGYPVVDAAMRQLAQTGWMHNRARMIVASFLVKDLLVDWRRGEKYFMQNLLDGDLAANNGGWQWTAGTGTDAAPYFRIFNPVLQGMKFDPKGAYVRRYVPELASVPDKFIHEPWKMSAAQQEQFGCMLGRDYPAPIVDHGQARERVLAAYKNNL